MFEHTILCMLGGWFFRGWGGLPAGLGVVHRCRGWCRRLSSRVEGDEWESIFEILGPVFQSPVS
jgi:hypothetical protein